MGLLSALFRNGSCLPRQDMLLLLGLEVDGMHQAAAYCTGRSTPSCALETANPCVREHTTFPRPRLLSLLPGLIIMTFQRLSSRRIQSSRPSQTVACPALRRVFSGFANSKSSSTLAHGVTLPHKPRFTAVYWPSSVKLFKNEGQKPKASTDDRPSTRKLLISFHFDSRALIAPRCATSLRRREPLCLVHHVHT